MSYVEKYAVSKRGQEVGPYTATEVIDLLRMKELSTIHKVKVGKDWLLISDFVDRFEKGEGLGIVRLGGGPDGTEGFGEFKTGKGQATCGQMGKDGGRVRKGFEEMTGLPLSCGNLFGSLREGLQSL